MSGAKQLERSVALLRGINVGGNHSVPMKELAALFTKCGCSDVATYIQSGNVVFQSAKGTTHSIGMRIALLIKQEFKFDVPVMTLSDTELFEALRNNPLPKAISEPSYFHVCFLAETPAKPDLNSLTQLKTAKEAFALKGRVFYMHTPDGAGNWGTCDPGNPRNRVAPNAQP